MDAAVRAALVAIVILALVVGGCVKSPSSAPAPPAATSKGDAGPLRGVIVILDPGHGGEDSGAVRGDDMEAALTYRTATEVARCLSQQGARVVFTVQSATLDPMLAVVEPPLLLPRDAVLVSTHAPLRLRHSPLALWQRAEIARRIWNRQTKSDPHAARDVFFVSLHYDDFSSADVSGSIVCVDRREREVPRLAVLLAADLSQGHWNRPCDFHGLRGIEGRKLGVIDPQYNPVPEKILLESATLSNDQDALEANDPRWRWEMAKRVTRAIVAAHEGQ